MFGWKRFRLELLQMDLWEFSLEISAIRMPHKVKWRDNIWLLSWPERIFVKLFDGSSGSIYCSTCGFKHREKQRQKLLTNVGPIWGRAETTAFAYNTGRKVTLLLVMKGAILSTDYESSGSFTKQIRIMSQYYLCIEAFGKWAHFWLAVRDSQCGSGSPLSSSRAIGFSSNSLSEGSLHAGFEP